MDSLASSNKETSSAKSTVAPSLSLLEQGLDYLRQGRYTDGVALCVRWCEGLPHEKLHLAAIVNAFLESHAALPHERSYPWVRFPHLFPHSCVGLQQDSARFEFILKATCWHDPLACSGKISHGASGDGGGSSLKILSERIWQESLRLYEIQKVGTLVEKGFLAIVS